MKKLRLRNLEVTRPGTSSSPIESQCIPSTFTWNFFPYYLQEQLITQKMDIYECWEEEYCHLVVFLGCLNGNIKFLFDFFFSDNIEVAYLKTFTKEDIIKFIR